MIIGLTFGLGEVIAFPKAIQRSRALRNGFMNTVSGTMRMAGALHIDRTIGTTAKTNDPGKKGRRGSVRKTIFRLSILS